MPFSLRRRHPVQDRLPGERAMLAAMAVDAVGSGMYVPFSLVFFHHLTGLSFATVGAVLSAVGLVGMAGLPLAGAAVDRFGARRVQLLLYGVRGTGFALYPFAAALPAFAAVALGTALGDRAFPAVQQSWIGEVAAGADRDRLQAASRALRNGGLGAGALLASLVVSLAGDRGFALAAWLNAASFGVAFVLMRRVHAPAAGRRSAAAAPPAEAKPRAGYRAVAADRPFLALTGVNFLTALGYSALGVLFPLFIAGPLHGPEALTGAAFTLNTVLCAAGGVHIARLTRRGGARRTRAAALGAVLFAASFAGLGLLATARPAAGWAATGLLLALVTLYTAGETVHSPAASSLAVAAAPEALRGRYLAAYQLSWSLAMILAPSLFTALAAADPRLPWLLLTGTALTAAAVLLRLERSLPHTAVHLPPASRAWPAPAAAPRPARPAVTP
ncbi:MFS transporter [Streptomyces sp. NRRL F-5123]|uniref:MFS transporter n=1 Tax=Streptomyces sp. NRRL F-5123 TaxID=1463856 RepID=UPI00069342F2|nr:MFS transporter [Streptomyces sp. NRRL F-5123]